MVDSTYTTLMLYDLGYDIVTDNSLTLTQSSPESLTDLRKASGSATAPRIPALFTCPILFQTYFLIKQTYKRSYNLQINLNCYSSVPKHNISKIANLLKMNVAADAKQCSKLDMRRETIYNITGHPHRFISTSDRWRYTSVFSKI